MLDTFFGTKPQTDPALTSNFVTVFDLSFKLPPVPEPMNILPASDCPLPTPKKYILGDVPLVPPSVKLIALLVVVRPTYAFCVDVLKSKLPAPVMRSFSVAAAPPEFV